jgi:PAS domain S-box-containing protein
LYSQGNALSHANGYTTLVGTIKYLGNIGGQPGMSEQPLDRLTKIVDQEREDEELWLSICPATWEKSQDAQITFDKQGKVFRANSKARLMLGYSEGQLRGKLVEDLIPTKFREAHIAHRTEYVTDPNPRLMGETLELWMLTADGVEIPVEISLSPLESERGLFINTVIRQKR